MDFRTVVPLKRQRHHLIDYHSKLFLVGSCFSDNIGQKFKDFYFRSTVNPLGILFHPLAIERYITRAVNHCPFESEDLIINNDLYNSFEAHSQFNGLDSDVVLANLNEVLDLTHSALLESTHIIITLGTSWVYRHIETDQVVANCHKIPQKKFLKELLSVGEVVNILEAIIELINSLNPNAKFIFTVSPVRHVKDGFIENNRSKAHLISVVHEVVENLKGTFYFPSYELLMDELRDYRFYATDMIHPSRQAVDFIWDQFIKIWLTDEAKDTYKDIEAYKKGLEHKPFNPSSIQHKEFLRQLKLKRELLLQKVPHLTL